MKLDTLTRQAIDHTTHCLIGCGIGEVTGMLIASSLGWHSAGRLPLAILLAFLFGYSLTYRSVRKHTKTTKEALKITAITDTASIAIMETIANIIEVIIPNALVVTAAQPRFWWGLALAMSIAFLITVWVNRYLISRNPHLHHHGHTM
jgi:hypothetical protein